MDKEKNIVKITCKIKDCVLSGYTTIGKIADVGLNLNNTETIPIFETPNISNSVALFNVSIDKITHIDDKPIRDDESNVTDNDRIGIIVNDTPDNSTSIKVCKSEYRKIYISKKELAARLFYLEVYRNYTNIDAFEVNGYLSPTAKKPCCDVMLVIDDNYNVKIAYTHNWVVSFTEKKDETEFVKVTYTQICGSDATRYKRVTNYVLKSDLDALFNNKNLTDDEINTTIVLVFDKASGFKDPICGKAISELTIDSSYCVSGVNDVIKSIINDK